VPERRPRAWLALAFALAAVAFLGDWLTGAEISFSPFYLVGIGVGTWFAGRRAGVALSLASTAGWVGAYLLTGQRYSRPSILYWNVLRTAEESLAPPDRVLADLNRQLARTIPEARFVTACYAVLEPAAGRFEYALAGHNSPLHVRGAAGPIDTLETAEGPFVLNELRANVFEWRRTVNRPGTPVDTTEWGITVPTVNAYYDPSKNEMVFPAGALVPQTFDPAADDAANYGSLGGSWAGHELTHGFDDEGRHYDATGNLRDWWTAGDSVHFTEQAQLVVEQFNGFVQVDTFHVNGKLTLGENIADYGGVLVGLDALERALQRDGRPGLVDGYTPEQRYFLAYAQSWRGHTRDASLRTRLTVDPHAPERWRTNGPLSNSAAFARAFRCKSGDPMVRPPERVPQIW